MTARTRPGAPWYAGATRRLTLLRLGLPTLLACIVAIGPGVAISAENQMTHDIAGLVGDRTARAGAVLDDGHAHGHRRDGATDEHRDRR